MQQVCANRGAAGVDRQTIADVEQHGIDKLLDEPAADLRRQLRSLPARRVFIPKPGRPNEQDRCRFPLFATAWLSPR